MPFSPHFFYPRADANIAKSPIDSAVELTSIRVTRLTRAHICCLSVITIASYEPAKDHLNDKLDRLLTIC